MIFLLLALSQDPQVRAMDGFKVELVRTAAPEEGSWVAMAFGPGGRLVLSPEKGALVGVEAAVGDAQGLLFAHDSLYVNGKGPEGTGLYRLFDRDGDGRYEETKLLRRWAIEMTEHGPHGVALGPDGKIYVVNGNYTPVLPDVSPRSPHRRYAEDLLLPRQWDATGHAVGLLAPGGVVYRTDPDGREWELWCGGLRNAYDLAFDPEGRLFTFDSDMERDLGTPWYRPTRILHLVPGGEYGWRSGTGKWPTDYPDVLPSVVDIGRSSPTGVAFGTGARFPGRYRRALFAADWAFGRILAVHLGPRPEVETFVSGEPLNVCDLEVGPDGALWFVTGGRGTRSRLYRVSSEGASTPAPAAYVPSERFARFAARLELERRPVEEWRRSALDGRSTDAWLALARCGTREDLAPLVERVAGLPWVSMGDQERVDGLRILGLAFLRLGPPGPAERARVLGAIDGLYPATSFPENRELAPMLAYLGAEKVVPRTLALLSRSPARDEQMHYAFVLRTVKTGWTSEERRRYFEWFGRFDDYRGDLGFPLFLRNVRSDALAALDAEERARLQPLLESQFRRTSTTFAEAGPVVQPWAVEDLRKDVENLGKRNFTRGKAAFAKARCLACHALAGEGGAAGPDLTGVAKRLGRKELLEAVLLPSKDISDQYRNTLVQLEGGEVVVGRLVAEDERRLALVTDFLAGERTEIPRAAVRRTRPSTLSIMPDGLLDRLTRYEALDLFAYLLADGKAP